MAKANEPYQLILVESYVPKHTSGLHGAVHIRPCPDQGLPTTMHVECSKSLSRNYPVGTIFRVKAKLTDRKGMGDFLYSYHGWDYDVVKLGKR
jgi:hypothetical protein